MRKPDEMERHIIAKAQRNAYLFLVAALLLWSLYESLCVFLWHSRLNLLPCGLLSGAALVQAFSQLLLTRRAVKDDEDSQETAPLARLVVLACVAAGVAWLIGLPVLRLKSDYLAIATLGFAEIIRAVFQWDGLGKITNGSNLLRKYTSFSDMRVHAGDTTIKFDSMFPFLIAMLSILIIVLLVNSSYGRAFKSIRDDEIAAEAMGINLFKHKMISFVVSSFFAGVGGALLAMFQTTIQAAPFRSTMTYEILLMVVIGGIGSISGSCIAAFLYIACSEWWLRFLDSGALPIPFVDASIPVPFFRDGFRKVVFSVIIMVIVLFSLLSGK